MAEREQPGPARGGTRPLVRDYSFLAVGALAVCALVLFSEVPGVWGLLPALLGLAGVVLRWGMAPGLYLMTLVAILLINRSRYPVWYRSSPVTDLVLATASLVYVAAQMRLQTLVRHGVPPDARRRRRPPGSRVVGRWFVPVKAEPRSGARAGTGELLLLLAGAPVFTLVAYLLWLRLAFEPPPDMTGLPPALWQVVVVLWGMAIGLALAYTFLSYLGRARASPEESALFLQDQLWAATRGEQRRMNRWLVWARLRRQRKEERS